MYSSIIIFTFQAQLLDLRSDLHEVRATKSIMEKEVNTLLLQLHASQLQLHQAKSGQEGDSEAIKRKLVSGGLCFHYVFVIDLVYYRRCL